MPAPARAQFLPLALLAGALAVLSLALLVPAMEVDSAEYGRIALGLLDRTDWLQITRGDGQPYLDKPPLLFWLEALSFRALGVSPGSLKLPSLIFAALALFSTWRLALVLAGPRDSGPRDPGSRAVGPRAAFSALLVLATCEAIFLFTCDCRTDMLVAGAVAFASWQLAAFARSGGSRALLFGCAGMGVGLLAKGPIGAMVPLLGLAADAAARRSLRRLFSPTWIAGLLVIAALLAPMLLGLYRQHGADGLRFFFWTQSFGRLTGESPWRDSTTPLYFGHTFLWLMAPWTPLCLSGLVRELRALFPAHRSAATEGPALTLPEEGEASPGEASPGEASSSEASSSEASPGDAFSLGALLLPFAALSFSHYKLPHYLMVVLPFAAVITGREIERLRTGSEARLRLFCRLQLAAAAALWGAALFLCGFVLPLHGWIPSLCAAALLGLTALLALRPASRWQRLCGPSAAAALGLNLLLLGGFFPALLQFQAGTAAAGLIRAQGVPAARVFTLGRSSDALELGLGRPIPGLAGAQEAASRAQTGLLWVFTDGAGLSSLQLQGLSIEVVADLPDFSVTRLNRQFLFPQTRESVLQRRFLLRLSAAAEGPHASSAYLPGDALLR